jgi:hypothetical protein
MCGGVSIQIVLFFSFELIDFLFDKQIIKVRGVGGGGIVSTACM